MGISLCLYNALLITAECVCVLRFDVDFTEVHSYMTRGEAILQSPEFSVSRKEGSIQELYDKVQV